MTIAHQQELELYHYSESFCSQKARLGMAEKDLNYKSNHIVIFQEKILQNYNSLVELENLILVFKNVVNYSLYTRIKRGQAKM